MGRVNCLKDFFVIVGFSFYILGSERKVLIGQLESKLEGHYSMSNQG